MSRVCSVCGKGRMSGNQVSHSHRKTRRSWAPMGSQCSEGQSQDHDRRSRGSVCVHSLPAFRKDRQSVNLVIFRHFARPWTGFFSLPERNNANLPSEQFFSVLLHGLGLPICILLAAPRPHKIIRKSLALRAGSYYPAPVFFPEIILTELVTILFGAFARSRFANMYTFACTASPQGKVRGALQACKVPASKPAAPFPHKSCSL